MTNDEKRQPVGVAPAGRVTDIDVVSVQSQVVYGRVGNNVAVPALEAMGLSVAAVPTVLLSNTPHYPEMHGGAVPLEWFAGYLGDLAARGALRRLRAIVTGYLGNAGQARALASWVRRLADAGSDARLITDPVLGDHGDGVYVEPELVDAYRQRLLPLAHGLTPNDFELSRLSGRTATDLAGVAAAARSLLRGRTRWVAVTSAAPATWPCGRMRVVLVDAGGAWCLTHPHVDVAPRGTGDLFNATLAANWAGGMAIVDAAVTACRRVLHAMRLTREAGVAELVLPREPALAAAGDVEVVSLPVR